MSKTSVLLIFKEEPRLALPLKKGNSDETVCNKTKENRGGEREDFGLGYKVNIVPHSSMWSGRDPGLQTGGVDGNFQGAFSRQSIFAARVSCRRKTDARSGQRIQFPWKRMIYTPECFARPLEILLHVALSVVCHWHKNLCLMFLP